MFSFIQIRRYLECKTTFSFPFSHIINCHSSFTRFTILPLINLLRYSYQCIPNEIYSTGHPRKPTSLRDSHPLVSNPFWNFYSSVRDTMLNLHKRPKRPWSYTSGVLLLSNEECMCVTRSETPCHHFVHLL